METNHYVRLYNHITEEWEDVKVEDLPEAEYRRWVYKRLDAIEEKIHDMKQEIGVE